MIFIMVNIFPKPHYSPAIDILTFENQRFTVESSTFAIGSKSLENRGDCNIYHATKTNDEKLLKDTEGNMASMSCKECGRKVSRNAKKCPQCGVPIKRKTPLFVWPAIFVVILSAIGYFYISSKSSPPSNANQPTLPEPDSRPLELISRKCGKENINVYVIGEVKNISSESMKDVMAVGRFRTKDGSLVKTEEAIIDSNPILPGQTSPFKVGGLDDPVITDCYLSFKNQSGQQLNYVSAKDRQNEEQQIREAQTLLSALGYRVGDIDGILGTQTITSIKEFQAKQGLPQDGKVSSQLIADLRKLKK